MTFIPYHLITSHLHSCILWKDTHTRVNSTFLSLASQARSTMPSKLTKSGSSSGKNLKMAKLRGPKTPNLSMNLSTCSSSTSWINFACTTIISRRSTRTVCMKSVKTFNFQCQFSSNTIFWCDDEELEKRRSDSDQTRRRLSAGEADPAVTRMMRTGVRERVWRSSPAIHF